MSDTQTHENITYPEHWRPSSLKDVLNRTPEPPPWVIEQLLPAECGILCSGQPHAGKSLNWLAAGLESVVRHEVWGKFGAGKVNRFLFIETEDPVWLVEARIHGLAKGLGLKAGDDLERYGFFFACTGPFELAACENQLRSLVAEVKPDWMVLSTLQGLLHGRDWSQQKDMGPINSIMVKLQRMVPLVAITHSPRDTSARRSAGTITQDANYLVTMNFQKRIQKDGRTITSVVGDSKMGTELCFDLTLETTAGPDGSPEVRRVVHSIRKETKTDLIRSYHAANPSDSPEEIADATSSSPQWVRKVLKMKEPGLASPPELFDESTKRRVKQ